MKVSMVVVLVPFCCWIHPAGGNSFTDFFVNIPKHIGILNDIPVHGALSTLIGIKHAWDTLIDVIKEPVRIRIGKQGRTTTRSLPGMKAAKVVHEKSLDLRSDSQNDIRIEAKNKITTPLSIDTTKHTRMTKATTPSLVKHLMKGKRHRLIIPIIKPLMYTEWATYHRIATTEKQKKTAGERNEDSQRPYKEYVEYPILMHKKQATDHIPTWKRIKIPIVLEPTYKSVNDWNNLQRPVFAQIKSLPKGSTRSTVSKIMNYYYHDEHYLSTAT